MEHPILFSTTMVKAILDDRKSKTRRVVKWPVRGYRDSYKTRLHLEDELPREYDKIVKACPYGQVGSRLWCKETFCHTDLGVIYKADMDDADMRLFVSYRKWKPSIFMPRKFSRITLEITNVRVEHLQEIKLEDCWDEGIRSRAESRIPDFKRLWDSINAKRGYGWVSNPFCWVIEFKVVQR